MKEPPDPAFVMPDVDEKATPIDADAAFVAPAVNAELPLEPVARVTGPRGTVAPIVRGGVARLPAPSPDPTALPEGVRAWLAPVAGGTGVLLGWLIAVPASLLPAPWRRPLDRLGLPWISAVVVSGILEVIVCGIAWARAFWLFTEDRAAAAGAIAATVLGDDPGDAYRAAQVMGFAMWVQFMLTPLALALMFLIVEGTLRAVAGAVTREVRGSFPLWVLERLIARLSRGVAQGLHTGIPDEVTPGDLPGGLAIASCRGKDWDKAVTIEFENRRYRLLRIEDHPGQQRPFLYVLRPAADHELVRRLHRYHPGEGIRAPAR